MVSNLAKKVKLYPFKITNFRGDDVDAMTFRRIWAKFIPKLMKLQFYEMRKL